ncbi:hypothetical protein DEJ50_18360 [Streptomyces venezuelae]|uniref:Lipoprotein n=1 Tax=Streptomyces venezuelae TaxID=54571 RepID=A0A5P2D4J5_STRVZ|nr:hypothetical protein DEJ50_18360 [Streptomyces venezuelae]
MRAAALVAVAAVAAACAHPLADLGPLPPRYSGPPLPADTVVRELSESLAEAGVGLERASQDHIVIQCTERLTGRFPAATADAALKDGFARARKRGWQDGPDMPGTLSLRRGNWTAMAQLPGAYGDDSGTTSVMVSLVCDGARSKPLPATPSTAPLPTGGDEDDADQY